MTPPRGQDGRLMPSFLHTWLCGGRRPWFDDAWPLALLMAVMQRVDAPLRHVTGVTVQLDDGLHLILLGKN